MIFRYARNDDETAVRRLWEEGFGSEEPYTSWYFREIYRAERTLAAFDQQGTMNACLQLAPYHLLLHGHPLPICYVVGVVTGTAYRGHGVGHALLKTALNHLAESGMQAAMLYTDIPEFYTPLGFVHCYQLRQLSFIPRPEQLPRHWQEQASDYRQVNSYQRIYRRMINSLNGSLLRNPQNWHSFLGEHYCDRGGVLLSDQAYILWLPDRDRLKIREIGYTDKRALLDAVEAARCFAAEKGFSQVCWQAPVSAPLLRQGGESRRPHVMARMLNAPVGASAAEIAAATLAMFGAPDDRLWVNELT